MGVNGIRKTGTRVCLAAAVVLAGAAPATATEIDRDQIEALPIARTPIEVLSDMNINLSGQISRQVIYVDNGTDTATGHTDNSAHPSYLQLSGNTTGGYGAGTSWGFVIENAINSGPSEQFDFTDGTSSDIDWQTREANVWVKNDTWGKVTMGRGAGAARYSSRISFSGTEWENNFDSRRASNIFFREDNGNPAGLTVGNLFPNNWGVRGDQLDYTSPTYAGTNFEASFGNNSEREFGLNYQNFDRGTDPIKKNGTWFAASVGHVRNVDPSGSGDQADARWLGSASILHVPTGLNATVGYINQHPGSGNSNPNTTWSSYTNLGYRWGNHAASVNYAWSRGALASGGEVEGSHWGLGYAWNQRPYRVGVGVEQYGAEFTNSGLPSIDNVRIYGVQFGVDF
jgi:hypothetical protein